MSNSKNEHRVLFRLLRWLSTVALTVFSGFTALASLVFSEPGQAISGEPGTVQGMSMLIMLVSLLVVLVLAGMVWSRRRWPFWYTIAGAIAGIILPVGPIFALVGLGELIARSRGKKLVVGSIMVGAVVLFSTLRDMRAPSPDASFLQSILGGGTGEPEPVPIVVVIGLTLFSVAIPVGIGLLMRVRRRERVVVEQRDRLDSELGRSHERERIAHEIHDVLGHRLSQLSLRASALEARAAQYPEISEEATEMRLSAGSAMDDLRSLLRVINGEVNDVSLTELNEIIRGSVVDEQPFALTVFLRDAECAPREIARAVVRVVQEIITNARKHAPGGHLRLSVTGGPGEGITITAANPLMASAVNASGTGRGLSGMHERLGYVGGQLAAGQVGAEFRVDAHIPWPD